jgi:hypothetical protein
VTVLKLQVVLLDNQISCIFGTVDFVSIIASTYCGLLCSGICTSVGEHTRFEEIHYLRLLLSKKQYDSAALVVWVLCHHCVAPPQDADGGYCSQVRKVAANTLHEQPQTVGKRSSLRLGVGHGANYCL